MAHSNFGSRNTSDDVLGSGTLGKQSNSSVTETSIKINLSALLKTGGFVLVSLDLFVLFSSTRDLVQELDSFRVAK